ncbi:MAG: ice-binding family protein [Geobacteraceae bacterium]|nr:ice-binding family protein [Geobacteraceae bacterium]
MPTAAIAGPGTLGSAASFGVFGGGAGMTNQGLYTVINGDIGTTADTTLVTGFHDLNAVFTETPMNIGTVNGTIHTAVAPAGSVPNAIAAAAALDIQSAYDSLSPAALPGGIDVSSLGGGAGELGNRTLTPGVYKSAPGTYAIQGGDLTLDAQGDPNAIFVFQMATSLLVGGPGAAFPQNVILVNGAQAKNVFWQVGSAATINAAGGGTMVGTIIASSGIATSTAGNVDVVTLNGRALALHASVTLVNTTINVPGVTAVPVEPPVVVVPPVVVPPIVPATPGVTVTGTQAADVVATAATGGNINVQNNGGHVAVTENGTGTINVLNNGQLLTVTNTGNGVVTINNTCTAAVTVTNTGNGNITVNATGLLPITLTYADGLDHVYP